MNTPKISIITVVKNGMPYLIDCLNSFQLQNYSNKEHIIIYSDSDDKTEEFLLSQKKNIKILKKDKKFNNKWDCLNLGAKLSTGDIIAPLPPPPPTARMESTSSWQKSTQKKIKSR